MGSLVSAMATSHAFAFLDPEDWGELLTRNRKSYAEHQGAMPPPQPEFDRESAAENERRFRRITAAHARLRAELQAAKPDLLLVIGDDQNENLTAANLPQIALYQGPDVPLAKRHSAQGATYRIHREFTGALVEAGVAAEFDIATLGAFADGELKSHAHAQVLEAFCPKADIPIALLFLNAIHHPAVEPRRCYALGEFLARFIAGRPASERVAICGSGGLSHFTAGYPWRHYQGPFGYGAICEDFDRTLIAQIAAGEGRKLAELSSRELLAHGEIELRAWIAVLGAVGGAAAQSIVYEPFYRAIMGMGVASWQPAA